MTGTTVLIFGSVSVFILGLILYGNKKTREFRAKLEQYAADSGLEFTPGKFFKHAFVSGKKNGRDLIVDTFIRDAGNTNQIFSRVRLTADELPP